MKEKIKEKKGLGTVGDTPPPTGLGGVVVEAGMSVLPMKTCPSTKNSWGAWPG